MIDLQQDGVLLGDPVDLGGSERSRVTRHRVLEAPPDWGRSVVVKTFESQPVGAVAWGYHREVIGLRHLAGTPELLLADDGSQTVVMADLGEHPTLADALLGDDPDLAWESCLTWAAALGSSVNRLDVTAAREALGDDVSVEAGERADGPRAGLAELGRLGIEVSMATEELRAAVEALEQVDERQVLAAGDTCPDNAMLDPHGVRFLDLEATGIRPWPMSPPTRWSRSAPAGASARPRRACPRPCSLRSPTRRQPSCPGLPTTGPGRARCAWPGLPGPCRSPGGCSPALRAATPRSVHPDGSPLTASSC